MVYHKKAGISRNSWQALDESESESENVKKNQFYFSLVAKAGLQAGLQAGIQG